MIIQFDRWTSGSRDQLPINTVLYTTSIINTPSRVESDIRLARERLMGVALRPLRREATEVLEAIRLRDEAKQKDVLNRAGLPDRRSVLEDPATSVRKFQNPLSHGPTNKLRQSCK
jgi:hypothetical protein